MRIEIYASLEVRIPPDVWDLIGDDLVENIPDTLNTINPGCRFELLRRPGDSEVVGGVRIDVLIDASQESTASMIAALESLAKEVIEKEHAGCQPVVSVLVESQIRRENTPADKERDIRKLAELIKRDRDISGIKLYEALAQRTGMTVREVARILSR